MLGFYYVLPKKKWPRAGSDSAFHPTAQATLLSRLLRIALYGEGDVAWRGHPRLAADIRFILRTHLDRFAGDSFPTQ